MSDIKLFKIDGNQVSTIEGQSVAIEKSLQTLLEKHLDTFLGVRLVKSEHPTGKTHGGRIDTSARLSASLPSTQQDVNAPSFLPSQHNWNSPN